MPARSSLLLATALAGAWLADHTSARPLEGPSSVTELVARQAQNASSPSPSSSSSGGIRPSLNTTSCPGYQVTGPAVRSAAGFRVPLGLRGEACNAYGVDLQNLTFSVVYEKPHQLHVHIEDAVQGHRQFQLPLDNEFLPRPSSDPAQVQNASDADASHWEVHYVGEEQQAGMGNASSASSSSNEPFAFWVLRKGFSTPVFDTRASNIPTYASPMNASRAESARNSTSMPSHPLVFENQYLQLSSALPRGANLYGLGERYGGSTSFGDASWRVDETSTLQPFFTLDAGDPLNSNMYGYHPIYLEVRNASQAGAPGAANSSSSSNATQAGAGATDGVLAHAVQYTNTAGLDVLLRPGVIQYRALGGTLDFRFFSGNASATAAAAPTTGGDSNTTATAGATGSSGNETAPAMAGVPATTSPTAVNATAAGNATSSSSDTVNGVMTAMEQLTAGFLGKAVMTPRWTYGFHMLRWGWETLDVDEAVVQNLTSAQIPFDALWNDLDYMQSFRDFTNDNNTWPQERFSAFIESLRSQKRHYVPLFDAAIPAAPTNDSDVYEPGTRGEQQRLFIRNENGTDYVGTVWPGYAKFIDEQKPGASEWWRRSYEAFLAKFDISGAWCDMAEPSSFCVGSCGSGQNLSDTPAYQKQTSQASWPEGYDNNTSGNSGNYTIDGQLTFREGFNYQTPVPAPAAAPQQSSRRRRGVAVQGDAGAGATLRRRQSTDAYYQSVPEWSYQNVSQRYYSQPPYRLHNGISSDQFGDEFFLDGKTVAMNARVTGYTGEDEPFYDHHNVWGSYFSLRAHDSLLALRPEERPFVVGRTQYMGSGKYFIHWLGDNVSRWWSMAKSIQGVLQYQLFGMPQVGGDTCGFAGNTDAELCVRWSQLAAMVYPFYRNHNVQGAIPQEPYRWDEVREAVKKVNAKRYEMMPYLYTAMHRATQQGTPAIRSVWMNFPRYFAQLHATDTQVMVGADVLVTPVLRPNATDVRGFFPEVAGKWRDIFSYEALDVTYGDSDAVVPAPLQQIPTHLRPGAATYTYARPAQTLTETAEGPLGVLANVDDAGAAYGEAYFDDGVSPLPTPQRELRLAVQNGRTLRGYTASASPSPSSASQGGDYQVPNRLERVVVLGVAQRPANVSMGTWEYDAARQMLNVTALDIDVNQPWNLSWA